MNTVRPRLAWVDANARRRAAQAIDHSPWDWYAETCPCARPAGECRSHPRARLSQRPPAGWLRPLRPLWIKPSGLTTIPSPPCPVSSIHHSVPASWLAESVTLTYRVVLLGAPPPSPGCRILPCDTTGGYGPSSGPETPTCRGTLRTHE